MITRIMVFSAQCHVQQPSQFLNVSACYQIVQLLSSLVKMVLQIVVCHVLLLNAKK